MKIYATSDQHFTHFNIIKYANRPFELTTEGVKDCINTIVNNHNKIVTNDDLVIHVGDLAHGRNQTKDNIKYIIEGHKGKRILVKGNHDQWEKEYYLSLFDEVHDYIIKDNIFICHYPCYQSRWTSPEEKEMIKILEESGCDTIIHGHVHNKNPDDWEPDGYKRINVCVDYEKNNFFPVEITDLFYK